MKIFFNFLVIALVFVLSQAHAEPAHIFIFRHGEKNNDQERDLSQKGYQRAEALRQFFSQDKFISAFGEPSAFFAARAKEGKSRRSIQTITPTANYFKATVDDSYGKGEEKDLMRDVLKDSSLDGTTVLIAWNHKGIPKFLKPLDIEDAPTEWDGDSYDRFWILSRKANGEWKFRDLPQRLLPGDSTR